MSTFMAKAENIDRKWYIVLFQCDPLLFRANVKTEESKYIEPQDQAKSFQFH